MSEQKTSEKETNLTQSDSFQGFSLGLRYNVSGQLRIAKTLRYDVENAVEAKTRLMKERFVEIWKQSNGVIDVACKAAGISRDTYYRWKTDDKKFADDVAFTEVQKNEVARDALWSLVTLKRHPASIRYWLDRRDPQFKPTQVQEVITGDRTLEDILFEHALKKKEEHEAKSGKSQTDTAIHAGQPGADRVNAENQGQEGIPSAVRVQSDPEPVLETKDEKKSDSEAEAKGTE